METQKFYLSGSSLPGLAGLPRRRVTHVARILCLSIVGLVLVVPAWAQPSITLGAGVTNPPPNLPSTGLVPQQIAVADTATLVPFATFDPLLQATLNAQMFTAANNWNLVNAPLMLANNATFNITQYSLSLNPAGTAFGETMVFNLAPNLAGPINTPPGSTVTEFWLQYVNTSALVNGFGFAIPGQPGFWQVDNLQKLGGPASGPGGITPYYPLSIAKPPAFEDFPHYYAGVGTYLHFDVIPTWDIYTPGVNGGPGTETIDVGNYGLAWGFQIVPEPSILLLLVPGLLGMAGVLRKQLFKSC